MELLTMPDAEENIYSKIGLTVMPGELPPIHILSPKQISYIAIRISGEFANASHLKIEISEKEARLKTEFYGLVILGSTAEAVIAKAQSRRYWRRHLQYKSDMARLNYEAEHRTVGGSLPNAQIYASDATLQKAREKQIETSKYLSSKTMLDTSTGKRSSLSDLADKALNNRFNELYWVVKNLEAIAQERGMGWLFVTYTAPPKFHPNPLKGKCTYDPTVGVKGSHTHILAAWARVRALLSKWKIRPGTDSYFGFRTAETHKDGSVHWHLLVFTTPEISQPFIDASKEHFPHYGKMKVEVGDPTIGSASGYIFKYLAKGFDLTKSAQTATNDGTDKFREEKNLASIRNGERVRAALQAMRVRQYQTFGVQNVLTLLRAINKISIKDFQSFTGEVAATVKSNIWRNPTGLKYLLEHQELCTKEEGIAPIMIVKEQTTTVYGEKSSQNVGLKIGANTIVTKGRFKIENQ